MVRPTVTEPGARADGSLRPREEQVRAGCS